MEVNIFAIVPVEVLADKRLTLEQMRVLIAIFSFRNKTTGLAWPTREQLAARCGGMHVSNISTATTALCNLGWLEKIGSGGKSRPSQFTIKIPEFLTVAESATVARSATVAEQATNIVETVAQSATSTVAQSATSTVAQSARGIEQTNKQTNQQINKSNRPEIPDWLPEKSLTDFKAHRKAMKKPMTDLAVSLLIAELEKLRSAGHDPIECLNAAILNGWQSPYPPRGSSKQAQFQTAGERRMAATDKAIAEWLGEDGKTVEGEVLNA